MKTLIYNGYLVLNGEESITNGAILLAEDKIIGIYPEASEELQLLLKDNTIQCVDVKGNYVLPGFIDIHTHGAVGHDFNDATQTALDAIAKEALKSGCTSFMASLGVTSHEENLRILDAYANFKPTKEGAHLLGIHEEGPYLSLTYKAVMDERYLRNPSIKELDEMIAHSKQSIKVISVAPEKEGMEEFIKYASDQHITVMMGHSDATIEEVRKGIDAGAKGFTHLYNAMSQHVHRRPGCVSGAFLYEDSIAELICDGFHVHPEVIKITYKILGPKRIALITDSMMGKGMNDGRYNLCGKECEKKGIEVRLSTGRIAGSAIGMDDAIRLVYQLCQCSLNDLVQMASVNPSILAQVDKNKGTLEIGKDGDICILDHQLNVNKVIINGEIKNR